MSLTIHDASIVCCAVLALVAQAVALASPELTPATAKENLIARKVAELVAIRCVEIARGFLAPMMVWCLIALCAILFTIASGIARSRSLVSDVLFFALYAMVFVMKHRPRMLNIRTLKLWTAALNVVMLIYLSPVNIVDEHHLHDGMIFSLVMRLVAGLHTRFREFALWNLAYFVTLATHFLHTDPSEECLLHDPVAVFRQEVVCSAAVLLFNRVVHSVMEAEARQQVEARASRSGLDATGSLLGAICDAVVELDEDLRLRDHSRSLATVLLHGPNHSLIGAKLDQFMHAEEDKICLNKYLQVPAHDTGVLADVFHLKMRDSLGSAIDMELFHVCFLDDLTELPKHIVGMREHGDPGVPQHSFMPEEAPIFGFSGREQEFSVVFYAVSLDVLQCSSAFNLQFGPCPEGAMFSDWLSPQDQRLHKFCEQVNEFAGGSAPTCTFELGALPLRLPGVDQARQELQNYCASFTLATQRLDRDDDEASERVLACMVLHAGGCRPGSHSRSVSSRSCAWRQVEERAPAPEEVRLEMRPQQPTQ